VHSQWWRTVLAGVVMLTAPPNALAQTTAPAAIPSAPGEWKDFYGDTQPAMPAKVRKFVTDAQACTHFSGEEAYDKERGAFLKKAMQKTCRNLDARKLALEKLYSANVDTLMLLEVAWQSEPMVLDPNGNYPPPPFINPEPMPTLPIGEALAATTGNWVGQLEYRDYQSNQWFGLPVKINIQAQPDGVTTVRTAQYDDGPQTGLVWITTVQQVDEAAKTLIYAIMRKGRELDSGASNIISFGGDRSRWTLVTQERRKDGNGFAQVRETTTYDSDVITSKMTALKEVDLEGDGKDEFLPRNRTVLTKSGK
jgi:hypothetical protein